MILTLAVLLSEALKGTLNQNGILTIEGSEDVTTKLFEEAVKSIQKENVKKVIFKGPKIIDSLPDFEDYPILKVIEFDGVRKIDYNAFSKGTNNKINEFILGESMEVIENNFVSYRYKKINLSLGPNLKKNKFQFCFVSWINCS